MRHSMREIVAAWACCGLVGLSALIVEGHDRPAIAVYAGVHIPARGGSIAPDLSIVDEFADDASDSAGTILNRGEPSLYSRREVAEILKMLATIVRSSLALNVASEEPNHGVRSLDVQHPLSRRNDPGLFGAVLVGFPCPVAAAALAVDGAREPAAGRSGLPKMRTLGVSGGTKVQNADPRGAKTW